jgi:hypothetical protein
MLIVHPFSNTILAFLEEFNKIKELIFWIHHVPLPIQTLAVRIARCIITSIGVERHAIVADLGRVIGSHSHTKLTWKSGRNGYGIHNKQWWPVHLAAAVAGAYAVSIRTKRVQRVARAIDKDLTQAAIGRLHGVDYRSGASPVYLGGAVLIHYASRAASGPGHLDGQPPGLGIVIVHRINVGNVPRVHAAACLSDAESIRNSHLAGGFPFTNAFLLGFAPGVSSRTLASVSIGIIPDDLRARGEFAVRPGPSDRASVRAYFRLFSASSVIHWRRLLDASQRQNKHNRQNNEYKLQKITI